LATTRQVSDSETWTLLESNFSEEARGLVAVWLQTNLKLRGGPEASVDGFAWSEVLSDELSRLTVAKDDSVFSYAQTPESSKFARQHTHIPPPPGAYVIKRPADVTSDARMQPLERGNDLV
jgi:hypothetical protein